MECNRITLTDFRNMREEDLELAPGLNIIFGLNGSGKTNLVESIYCFSIAKSFRETTDKYLIRLGATSTTARLVYTTYREFTTRKERMRNNEAIFCVRSENLPAAQDEVFYPGELTHADREVDPFREIRVVPENTGEWQRELSRMRVAKEYFLRGMKKKSFEFVGSLRSVLYTPESINIVKGTPGDRRRFLDIAISQYGTSYVSHLALFNRVLKTRSKAISESMHNPEAFRISLEEIVVPENRSIEVLVKWYNEELATFTVGILQDRIKHVRLLEYYFNQIFREIYDDRYFRVDIKYNSSLKDAIEVVENKSLTIDEKREIIAKKMHATMENDIKKNTSPNGPHKDDIILTCNGIPVDSFASQGQQRIISICLKLAEGKIHEEMLGEPPVYLLDDVMSELDRDTQLSLTKYLDKYQAIITTADSGYVDAIHDIFRDDPDGIYPCFVQINKGKIHKITDKYRRPSSCFYD